MPRFRRQVRACLAGGFPLTAAGLLGALAACCPNPFYELVVAEPTVRLPRDEAPHCFGGGEWWYYTGRLTTDDRRGFGIEAVIFHVPGLPYLLAAETWIAHYAVLDEGSGSFVYDQTRIRSPLDVDASKRQGFKLHTPLVQMSGSSGDDHIQAAMSDGNYALDLTLNDERGPILHGGDGYVPYGVHGRSFYYSRPRMPATGTLVIDGLPRDVAGHMWFDRQWGLDIVNPRLGWDWFSVRLDDGTDIMLFIFRDQPTPIAFGTYMPAGGDPHSLAAADFTIEPTSWWTSPHTGILYPVRWNIRILPDDLTLTVTAVANDQELDVRATTFNIYWEGLCTVAGTRGDEPVTGHCYAELANPPRYSTVARMYPMPRGWHHISVAFLLR